MATTTLLAELIMIGVVACIWITLLVAKAVQIPITDLPSLFDKVPLSEGGMLLLGIVLAYQVGSLISAVTGQLQERFFGSARDRIFRKAQLKYEEARILVYQHASSDLRADLGVERAATRLGRAGMLNVPMLAIAVLLHYPAVNSPQTPMTSVLIIIVTTVVTSACLNLLKSALGRYYHRIVLAYQVIVKREPILESFASDAAIERYDAALRPDPDLVGAHLNLGFALSATGELDAAIGHYNDALRIDPDYAKAHYNLGLALGEKGELDAAIEHYKEALRIDPDYAFAHYNLGMALVAKGEPDAAIEHHNAAIRINPKIALFHYNLARALAQKEDAAAAVAALAKGIELDTRHRDQARSVSDFDRIRDDPAFRKLVYGE